eukprot:6024320-Alexandrium_andersonii.AAC.1
MGVGLPRNPRRGVQQASPSSPLVHPHAALGRAACGSRSAEKCRDSGGGVRARSLSVCVCVCVCACMRARAHARASSRCPSVGALSTIQLRAPCRELLA